MSISDMLVASWYGKRKPLWVLYPLTKIYEWIVTSKRKRYLKLSKKTYYAPVPVIVVGNITVGGTGKTPMILWLIDYCQHLGIKVGVVSRGYGAKPPRFPWLVKADQMPNMAGDEPLLIAQRTNVPIVIDPNRSKAVQFLLDHFSVDIILSDDGLQHYALGRNLELVMVDAVRQFGNGYCLPMGPLREPMNRLESVDAIIYNGLGVIPENGFSLRLQPQCWVNIRSNNEQPLSLFTKKMVHAVAGIGNPDRFFCSLIELGLTVIPHSFTDHCQYTSSLLNFNDDIPVVMTEKDAVKCRSFAQENWWYLKVDAELSTSFTEWIDQKLLMLRKNNYLKNC